MRRLVIVVVLLLTAAPAAHAEVTIGSALTNAPDATFAGGTVMATEIPERRIFAPISGVITRWRIRANAVVASTRLVVIRRPGGVGANSGEVLARSAPTIPVADDVSTVPARLRIAAGDYIGIEGSGGYLTLATGPTVDTWVPALDEFVPRDPTSVASPLELLVNADIEPDQDGDGLGDETQDIDDDADGINDDADNCSRSANPGQEDADGDDTGDACDGDRDGDGVANAADVCPGLAAATANGCPAPPAAPRVNTPPVVRFRTPMSGTAVRASQTIELDVADDAGAPRVTIFDDDGQICALSAPPYSCTWRPTGADVGRATLLASAVDSDNRSTLGIVRVTVARFRGDLTRRVRGRKVTGRLVLPAAVEKALGCRGEVTVRRGPTTRTVALKRNCAYSARVGRRGRVRARFAGNPVVEPAT